MNKTFISILVGGIIVLGLLLFQASQGGTSEVLTPSELLARGPVQKNIRVVGRVAEAEISYRVEPSIELVFFVKDPVKEDQKTGTPKPGQLLKVRYLSPKPSMFASGRDVIIDGSYQSGTFEASSLLTQCPSKYEPPTPDHSHKNYEKQSG